MTTLADKTAPAAPGSSKQASLPGLNIILLALLAATMLSLPVGAHPVHCAGGILMFIGCGLHLTLHGRWIKAVIVETPKCITPTLRRQRRLFWGLLFSGLICGLSGVVSLPLHVHDPLVLAHCCLAPVHVLSGLVFCGLNIYHLVQHRNWFAAKLRGTSAAAKD